MRSQRFIIKEAALSSGQTSASQAKIRNASENDRPK